MLLQLLNPDIYHPWGYGYLIFLAVGIVYVAHDLSARKKSKQVISRLSRAVEQSPATIMITNTHGELEYVNPAFTRITGYAAAEVLGKNPRILQSGQTPKEEYVRLWSTIQGGDAWQGEFCNRQKNGELYWESATVAPITDNGGVITHYVAIKEDITERRAAEQQVRQAKEEWERTFDAITDPVMILDLDHRIVRANKAVAAALNITAAEAIGVTCYRAVHGAERPHDACPHAALLKDGLAHSREVEYERLGGCFLESVSPLRAADGTLIGSIHTARDISALKKASEMNEKYAYDLEQLLGVSRQVTTSTDIKSLFHSFVATARDVLALDCSTLCLLSPDKRALTVKDTIGFPGSHIDRPKSVEGQGLVSLVVKSRKAEFVSDFTCERRFVVPAIVWEKNLRSAVAVPMMMNDEMIGVLVGHTSAQRNFSPQEVSLYQQIANQAAVAIQNSLITARLRISEKKLQDITSSLGEGVYVLDEQGQITFMNPEAEQLLGWTQAELVGKNLHEVVHSRRSDGSSLSFDQCPIHNVMNTGKRYVSHNEVFIRKDQSRFPAAVIAAPIFEDDKVIAAVTAFRDISEIKEVHAALNRVNLLLEHQASTDPLTGIYNRFKFDKMLTVELTRARRHSLPLALVMIDIDHFKKVNDTFGHHMGDLVLIELARQMAKNTRGHDCFARWGGEEFMILLPHTTTEKARQFAEKCRQEVEQLSFEGVGGITCSFGVTELTLADDLTSFAKRVDAALYQAKARGRNRVVTF